MHYYLKRTLTLDVLDSGWNMEDKAEEKVLDIFPKSIESFNNN